MSTKFNYTNRIALAQDVLRAQVLPKVGATDKYEICFDWRLTEYSLPSIYELVFVLKVIGQTHREKVAAVEASTGTFKVDLAEISTPQEITVTMKVVSRDSNGVPIIIAILENFQPEFPKAVSSRRSLLKTTKDSQLSVPWRLQIDDGIPTLHISDRNGVYDKLTLFTPEFDALVLPDVVRQIFLWLVSGDDEMDSIHAEGWKAIFEELGCPRSYFDGLSEFVEMTSVERLDITSRSNEVSEAFVLDQEYFSFLAAIERGDE